MKGIRLLLVAAAGFLSMAGVAMAAPDNSSSVFFAVTPDQVPMNGFEPATIFVNTHTDYADPAEPVDSIESLTLFFDDDFSFSADAVAKCNPSDLGAGGTSPNMARAMEVCGSSRVGSGTGAITNGDGAPQSWGCVLLFNATRGGAGNPRMVLYVRWFLPTQTFDCSNPAQNQGGAFTALKIGSLVPVDDGFPGAADFGRKVTFLDPTGVRRPLIDLSVLVGRGDYFQARCHDANTTWNTRVNFNYLSSDQPSDVALASQPCTVG